MDTSKYIKYLTLLTGVLTVLVCFDNYLFGYGFILVPLTVVSAIIASIFAMVKKNYLAVLLNIILGIIAVVALILFDM